MNEITTTQADEEPIATTSDMVAIAASSEHATKVSTAKRYPRSIKAFKQTLFELACMDEETAASCFYVIPRAGKTIEGPSVRFAEIVASCWGNLQYGSRVIALDDEWITTQGICYDYEKNNSCSFEVRKRITDKNGRRYSEDMIEVTGRATCAKAFREAVFKIVPRPFWQQAYEQAKLTSIGKGKTMAKMREDCFNTFKKAGINDKQLLTFIGRSGIDDVTTDDIITLRGVWTAAKEEGVSVESLLVQSNAGETNRVQPPKLQ
jgi:hypothetical protein